MNKSSFEVLLLENVFNNWTLSEIHKIAFSMKTNFYITVTRNETAT